jgi:hypothetical protein
MHAPPHDVAVAIVVIGIAVGVIRIAVVVIAVIIGVGTVPSISALVVKPVVEITAMESATCHGPPVKPATAKSAAKTTGAETASTKTATVEAASAKTASAAVEAAAAKAATAVASASAATSATAGQGDVRRKHANRGSCDYGYDRFTQHELCSVK